VQQLPYMAPHTYATLERFAILGCHEFSVGDRQPYGSFMSKRSACTLEEKGTRIAFEEGARLSHARHDSRLALTRGSHACEQTMTTSAAASMDAFWRTNTRARACSPIWVLVGARLPPSFR
jgi:hypothetical protein